jgi:hypothetical protein
MLVDAGMLPARPEGLARIERWLEELLAGQPASRAACCVPSPPGTCCAAPAAGPTARTSAPAPTAACAHASGSPWNSPAGSPLSSVTSPAPPRLTSTAGSPSSQPGPRTPVPSGMGPRPPPGRRRPYPRPASDTARPGAARARAVADSSALPARRHLAPHRPRRRRARAALRPAPLPYGPTPQRRCPASRREHLPGPGQLRHPAAQRTGPLINRLAARARARPRGAAGRQWLFPGLRPGEHLRPAALGARLRRLGPDHRTARNGALIALAAELPAPVLASLLGLHQNTAIRWTHYAEADWATYLAARARTQPATPAGCHHDH